MKIIKTYEEGCKITGDSPENLPDISKLPVALGKHVLATIKLNTLERAQNKGAMPDGSDFVPDFGDDDQYKYTPWLEWVPTLGRFVFTCAYCTRTDTHLGARFWFVDQQTAKAFFETHEALINDLMTPELFKQLSN
jgi:hypothetical protein